MKSPAIQFITMGGLAEKLDANCAIAKCTDDLYRLAIKAGMRFSADEDVSQLLIYEAVRYRHALWNEQYYTLAVEAHNLSFCKAVEKARNRRPWYANGVTLDLKHTYFQRRETIRSRSRLCVDAKVDISGIRYVVTSFSAVGEHINLVEVNNRKRRMRLSRDMAAELWPTHVRGDQS